MIPSFERKDISTCTLLSSLKPIENPQDQKNISVSIKCDMYQLNYFQFGKENNCTFILSDNIENAK